MEPYTYRTYEEMIPVMTQELEKRKHFWRLRKGDIQWEDVKQECLIHIFKKYHLFKQDERKENVDENLYFVLWVNTVITNFLINFLRNKFSRFVRPCIAFGGCARAESDSHCSLTKSGLQDNSCPLYAEWEKKVKGKMEAAMPSSLEDHSFSSSAPTEFPNHKDFLKNLLPHIIATNDKKLIKIYKLIYIRGLNETEAAKKMGYHSKEKQKQAGYKTLQIYKKKIYEIAKKVLAEEDYQFI